MKIVIAEVVAWVGYWMTHSARSDTRLSCYRRSERRDGRMVAWDGRTQGLSDRTQWCRRGHQSGWPQRELPNTPESILRR